VLCSILSEQFGDTIETTLIDKDDAFVFGYSKLDVMFGPQTGPYARAGARQQAGEPY
jgi:sulfide:quinone oxidoreductase